MINLNNESEDKRAFVLVEFKGNRRELFHNPYQFPFKPGDYAIVEADHGEDAGTVKHVLKSLHQISKNKPIYSVIRRALSEDHRRIEHHRTNEKEALQICSPKVAFHNLKMHLVDAEFSFDALKLTFFFTSESRVDFRELVRDLARSFRTRIELRQIGSRDELRRCGGYGVCGREACCASFLQSFSTISTQMAKDQGLILNSTKLSGLCGRLKCCLKFECDNYLNPEEATEQSTQQSLN